MNNYLVLKHIHITLEFKLENRSSWRKTSQGKGKNQQQTQSHMASTPGFQPGQH